MADLTQEQKNVIRSLIISSKSNQITTLGGYAGTGKTTLVKVLSDVLPTYAICAFTGKAANVLRKKGLQDASTIHSLIYKPMQVGNTIEFVLKEREEMWNDGFLVDESSMISKELYEDLVSFNKPIIFIGDHGQLEPVGQNVNVMANPMYRLEQVHRNAGEIAHFAEHIRKGKPANTFAATEKVELLRPSDVTDDHMLSVDQMICAYNKTRVEKNNYVRNLLGHKAILEDNEKIMCLRNNKRIGIFNGMQGNVVKLHRRNKFDFYSDGIVYLDIQYDPRQFGQEKNQFEFGADTPEPFDYAYCITCHKSQGDQFQKVMVYEQECSRWDHLKWLYTAVTRAVDKVVVVTQKQKQASFIPSWL